MSCAFWYDAPQQALAAPNSIHPEREHMGYDVVGLLILILDIYVIIQIVRSGASPGAKLLWVILVLLLPLIGPILYFVLGRQGAI
jgi:hypothetical protein